jgi:hypothetical protein
MRPNDKQRDIRIINGNNEGRRFVYSTIKISLDILTIENILKKEKTVVNKTRKSVK